MANKNNLILTFFMQEMLKKNFLTSASVYISYSHKKKIVEKYLLECDKVFKEISFLLKTNKLEKKININVRSDV